MNGTLNLGCGTDIRDAHNVDKIPLPGVDQVVNLDEYPWPWDDGAFNHVVARHIVEHLADPMQAISEIRRVLRIDGTLELVYPIGHTRFEDPTHQNYWNYNTAEAIAGQRKHCHEHALELTLVDREVEYTVNSPLWRQWVRYKIWKDGYGPWLSQIPTLYGEIKATYKL